MQGVGATKIHGRRRGSVDHKLTGGSPNIGVNRSTIEGDPLQSCSHGQQTQTRAWVDLDLADLVSLQGGARLMVGFKNLPDPEPAGSVFAANRCSADSGRSCNSRHIPTGNGRRKARVSV